MKNIEAVQEALTWLGDVWENTVWNYTNQMKLNLKNFLSTQLGAFLMPKFRGRDG